MPIFARLHNVYTGFRLKHRHKWDIGIRDIEPFHKVLKSYLHLEDEFQMRSYDAMVAHATIVMTRYILLAIENRENKDWRSVNDGYHALCQELEDISFAFAFELILAILTRCSSEHFCLSSEQVDAFVAYFIADLPSLIKEKLKISMCES